MIRRLIPSLCAFACGIPSPVLGADAQSVPPLALARSTVVRPAGDVALSIGRGELVTVPGAMADIFVSNETVADVQVKSAHQLYLFGKSGGETAVYASNAAGAVIWSANVRVGSNIDSVGQMLRTAMPEASIGVSTMGTSTFLLTGTVASPDDVAEAERLVSAFVGKEANVISRLRTATPLQVNLQVRIAEVSRTLVREIGTNFMTRDAGSGMVFGLSRGRGFGSINPLDTTLPQVDASSAYGLPAGSLKLPFDPRTGRFVTGPSFGFKAKDAASTALNFAGKLAGLDIASALDLGEQAGLVTILSQPNLTALSGETADFLAGGEFPVPINQGLGATSVEYRKFGVSLSYTPTVLANGRIVLRVRPEVSELSSDGAVTLGGFQIPALTIRRAETTVELGSGQSFMIAGLMRNNSQNSVERTPGAGDLPILGALFRSTAYRKGETELVIVVTPFLVKPVNAGDIKLPTDGFRVPNELQQLLGGMSNDGVSGRDRPKPSAAPEAAPAAAAKR
ncbi:MAG: type II and III secretion system protein family protein [Novosphingobium sp.]